MPQRTFFDDEHHDDLEAKRFARVNDPETSHLAAQKLLETLGKRERQALAAVKCYPYSTANELEARAGWQLHKRLSGLKRKGLVKVGPSRACFETGNMAQTWVATDHGGSNDELAQQRKARRT